MKKLMMAVAIVCAAVLAHGASIEWASSKMYLQPGTATTAAEQITGYLFMIDATTYQGYIDDGYTATGTKLSDKIWADYGSKLATANATETSTKAGKISLDSGTDYGVGTYYAALIYTDNVTAGDYYMGNIAKATVDGTLDVSVADLGTTVFGDVGTVETAWSAAPEPTSGLLLLIGMAGLALRRRRA